MSPDDAEWLAQEVIDLLDAGAVGLYEFIWALRQRYPGGSVEELRGRAEDALALVRGREQVQVVRLVWPNDGIARDASWDEIDSDAWADIGDEPYLAITRTD